MLHWFEKHYTFFTLTVYHKKQFANNFIATKMIEDFVRLPWNFRWCLTCVSFGTGSNFVRIGNCFLWFLHDPLLCLVKIPEKWCNFKKKTYIYFWMVWADTQITPLKEGRKYRSLKGLKESLRFFFFQPYLHKQNT